MNNETQSQSVSRRALLRLSGMSVAFLTLGGTGSLLSSCAAPQTTTAPIQLVAQPVPAFAPDLEIDLTATETTVQILPGALTKVLSYQGKVLQGDPGAVVAVPNSYLGPIIRTRTGQKVRIRFQNNLNEASNIHWHGVITPPTMDGHPRDLAAANGEYVYEFEVRNRAGAYWFHPHAHERTAEQAYHGLAGLFIVNDEEEEKLALPTGAQEIPLVLQDRRFDADNQFVYITADMGGAMDGMTERMMGFLGDRILVNGQPDVTLPVATRAYRLRLLNGSNSRIFKLGWSNGMPMMVIATDGGLLEKPLARPYITLAPGERIELWADFRMQTVGAEIKLQSLTYSGVEAGMMEHTAELPNGAPFDVLTVKVDKEEAETLTLPTQLARMERYQVADAGNQNAPRQFVLSMDNNMNWTINGRAFVMDEVAADEQIAFGALEVWEFVNEMPASMTSSANNAHSGHGAQGTTGTMQMQSTMMGGMQDFMAHPMHLHGVQFQVAERQIAEEQRTGWETVKDGYVDEGWKDTVLVMPGERVKLLMRFADYRGMYVYHCHNLEHEDMGMMRNYLVD